AAPAVGAGRRWLAVGEVVGHDPPATLPDHLVVYDRVVVPAGDLDPRPDGGLPRDPERRDVGVVVVVDEVVPDERARALPIGTSPVLGGGLVVVVQAVRDDAGPVEIELAVLDDQMAAGVRPGIGQRAVLPMAPGEHYVAIGTCPDVVGGVAHVAGIREVEQAGPVRVAGEDPVLGHGRVRLLVVGGGGRKIPAGERAELLHARPVAAVEPDLVALSTGVAGQVVADGEVLHADPVRLEHLDPVSPGRLAVVAGRA